MTRRTPAPLLPASPGDRMQHGENTHRLPRRHLTCRSIMHVVRKSREVRKVWGVIPTPDQLVVGIGPVIAVGNHRDLTRGEALHIFGKLELTAIGQREPNTQVAID